MLKKLIILLGIFAIENSINCAAAQDDIGANYITQVSDEDLAQISLDNDICAICRELFHDTSSLYKSNCPTMFTHPHIFHRECILEWITSGELLMINCPICSGEMIDINAALIGFARNGYLEDVRLLLDRGDDINVRDDDGYTALILASKNGHLETVRLLLDRGADANARGIGGFTALMFASLNDNLEIVRLLLDRGANINTRDAYGFAALMNASQNGHLEIVRLLLDRGADINVRNIFGNASLMYARQNGHQEVADLLIARMTVWDRVTECAIL